MRWGEEGAGETSGTQWTGGELGLGGGNRQCRQHSLSTFFFLWRCGPTRARTSSFLRFLDHTQRRITVVRTPLDQRSARRRDLYLTTHNTHNRQTSMPPVGFEPTISGGKRPQTYALDRAATGAGVVNLRCLNATFMTHDMHDGREVFNHAANCYNDAASATIKEIHAWSIGRMIPTGETPQYLE